MARYLNENDPYLRSTATGRFDEAQYTSDKRNERERLIKDWDDACREAAAGSTSDNSATHHT